MKVLFICRGNVGRSQMAAAFYNQLTKTNDASSAGTNVETQGQTLLERKKARPGASFVVDVMREVNIDISNSKTKQLTKGDLTNYDLIVNMAGKKYTPKWLTTAPNYMYWKIRDPMGRNHNVTVRARDIIRKNVEDLIHQNT
jgi:arsenate reductase